MSLKVYHRSVNLCIHRIYPLPPNHLHKRQIPFTIYKTRRANQITSIMFQLDLPTIEDYNSRIAHSQPPYPPRSKNHTIPTIKVANITLKKCIHSLKNHSSSKIAPITPIASHTRSSKARRSPFVCVR